MVKLTGKNRLSRSYLGEEVDQIPWAPMLYQWFNVNKYRNNLPEQLKNCKTTLDALRAMKADLFAKHEAFIVSAHYSKCSFKLSYKGNKLRNSKIKTCLMDLFGPNGNIDFLYKTERHDYINTTKGLLNAIWRFDEKAGAPYEVKNLWTDFKSEFNCIRALLEDIDFVPDSKRWENVISSLENDGIAHLRIPPTPLKMLHWLAGPERSVYFMTDYPDEIAELVRIYESKLVKLVKKVIKFPEALVYTSGDNMDSLMYCPNIFNEFCGNSFRKISEIIHNEGKLLFTHACGQLSDIIKLCYDSGIDGVEGIAPPPLGDLDFGRARQILGSRFVLQGGMTFFEEELHVLNAREKIFEHVKNLFDSLSNKKAFIFGSGCCTSPRASYENLLSLRDACWKYGK